MSLQYTPDITQLEKKAGQKAAKSLRRNLKLELANIEQTGVMLKAAGASVKMKFGVLDHIAITATKATFQQHYGFEGIKKNGVAMNMKPFNHFGKVFEKDTALGRLLDELTDIRGEAIMQNIRF